MTYTIQNFPFEKLNAKKLISFDADGTLVLSKTPMDAEMVAIFNKLLHSKYMVNIVSGGKYSIFFDNIISKITDDPNDLKSLTLSPTCGAKFFEFDNQWQESYKEELSEDQKKRIYAAFDYALKMANHQPQKLYGELIEDRGTQITFSAAGSTAPLEIKNKYDPDFSKRLIIKKYLDEKIGDLDVKVAGTTSIDVTKKGINKAYAMKKLMERFNLNMDEILFIGDALLEGGNDEPVSLMGIDSIEIKDVEETKTLINKMLSLTT
ncbi:HAD family hydrolase [candidate division WWE3 bacterium CG_4_9_14_0_2_um_filter_35_11]|uniref:HAD family hydrolase n=1 Tax=candidate division WWE3 bacterium CG_4_9_14_0_2_um_filter_35_11 TaxID=1975077 RepID=A0A2M8EL92_UNCKA|nr:MAG: HAD family hydrolase [candidate division WWE3 bacterium CG10_big_fil_rev_8_21_14_0_10_35_32]PJC23501.1 MAG: HAD family hydrolase [candidate division WWE3 bacterium CG_4_9_14_0_2_um_filter_35_11]